MNTHNQLRQITAAMPCKTIEVDGKPYLRRYYAGETLAGEDIWLHEFLRADTAEHLHNHPFRARSFMLCGGYTEENEYGLLEVKPVSREVVDRILSGIVSRVTPTMFTEGRRINPFLWHRIISAQPKTWTAMFVEPGRLPFWYFDGGGTITPVAASPRRWWEEYGPREGH